MDIKIIASGSTGNCYRISDGHTPLLLECGISFKRIQQALGYSLSGLGGCLITHEHLDHCKAVVGMLSSGVECYLSKGTLEQLGVKHHRLHIVKKLEQFEVGTWSVLPFEAMHDAKEPLSFLLKSKETGDKLLFATDTYYIKHRFSGLTHVMIECNYGMEIINRNIYVQAMDSRRKDRILHSHMNLDNLLGFFRANDLSKVKEIYLLHLSDTNSDEALFRRKVMEVTGCPVCIA